VLREYLVVATRSIESNGLGLSLADALANRDMLEARMRFLDETHAVSVRLSGCGSWCNSRRARASRSMMPISSPQLSATEWSEF